MKNILLILLLPILVFACTGNDQKYKPETDEETTTVVEEKENVSQYGMIDNPQGLEVGAQVPDLTMLTDDAENITLASLYKDQPLVVLFYRGYWCPACNKHLSEFAERTEEIEKAGARIVAITPESYENTEKTMDETGINFIIISDTDGSVMKAFDVDFKVTEDYQSKIEENYNTTIKETNDSDEAVLPVPATYIIDQKGKIIYRQFNPDYKNRATIDEVIAHLPKK